MTQDHTSGGPVGPAPRQPGIGGWTRAILIGSLVLNLVLIGAIAGAGFSHRLPRDTAPPRGADAGLGALVEALPTEARRALRREIVATLRAGGALRGEALADTRALLAALRDEPFDRATVETLLTRQQGRALRLFETGSDGVVNRIAAMSPEERRAYADRLEQVIRRRAPFRTGD